MKKAASVKGKFKEGKESGAFAAESLSAAKAEARISIDAWLVIFECVLLWGDEC